jgi:hypothetical protein
MSAQPEPKTVRWLSLSAAVGSYLMAVAITTAAVDNLEQVCEMAPCVEVLDVTGSPIERRKTECRTTEHRMT